MILADDALNLFNRCLAEHIGTLHPILKRQIIAIDDHNQTYIGHAAKNLGSLRGIVPNLLKIDLTDTRSLPKKRRRAMLDLTCRDSLLSLA